MRLLGGSKTLRSSHQGFWDLATRAPCTPIEEDESICTPRV